MNTTTLNPTEQQEKDVFDQVRKLRGFYLHLMKYVIVNLGLLAINLLSSPHTLWVVWVALGWGLGLLLHAFRVFRPAWMLGPDWEKREIEKRLGRPL